MHSAYPSIHVPGTWLSRRVCLKSTVPTDQSFANPKLSSFSLWSLPTLYKKEEFRQKEKNRLEEPQPYQNQMNTVRIASPVYSVLERSDYFPASHTDPVPLPSIPNRYIRQPEDPVVRDHAAWVLTHLRPRDTTPKMIPSSALWLTA